MKKINIIVLSITLGLLLLASSIMITTQAIGNNSNKEYTSYDLKIVYNPIIITKVDASGAPELIIMDHQVEGALEGQITIGDKIYTYPEDFEVFVTHHIELNALTGKGTAKTEGSFIFKIPGTPTLTFYGVARFTGLLQTPQGTLINPENFEGQGNFELTGTKKFSRVEGFGNGDTIFYPPQYTNQYVHQIGYIKGWPQ